LSIVTRAHVPRQAGDGRLGKLLEQKPAAAWRNDEQQVRR
jgi:hypothetical protein